MKVNRTIARKTEESDPHGFSRLRKEGIEISQELSGSGWTDYNFHDPGVTILEQVCFALTDLIYRSTFDVADYMCDERGDINTTMLALHDPQDVFFGRPGTILDLQKSISDLSNSISDVQIGSGGYGLYDVQIRIDLEKGGLLADNRQLINHTLQNFNGMRNLCEDLNGEITVVEEIECYLEAEISIRPGYRAAEILAAVYFRAENELAKGISYQSYSEGMQYGTSLDEIFKGPHTTKGLIADEEFTYSEGRNSRALLESIILSTVREIDGVEYVSSLRLLSSNADFIHDELPNACAFRLQQPVGFTDIKGIRVKSAGRIVSFPIDEFLGQLDTLKFVKSNKSYALEDDLLLSDTPKGIYRNITQYQSLQNQFPAAYGINRFGIPENYPTQRKAQALQLKSYLLLFEQLMSNYLANLGSLKQLFSIKENKNSTYYSGILKKDEISSLDQVYPENAQEVLDNILGQVDDFIGRKNRMLDYLLALYGEEFKQEQIRNINYYYTPEELERHIILNKIRLINRIKFASGDRAGAMNIYTGSAPGVDPAEGKIVNSERLENVSGLQYRVSIFLGFKHLTRRSLIREIFNHELKLLPHENYCQEMESGISTVGESESVRIAKELYNEMSDISEEDEHFYQIMHDKYVEFEPLRDRVLSESLLRNGVQRKNYLYKSKSAALFLELSDMPAEEGGGYKQERLLIDQGDEAAQRSTDLLRRFLIHLNEECEGMHVLEHILLRPRNFASRDHAFKQKYANRVSVIFPAWTARCHDAQFRAVAEDVVRENCPAHIYPEIYWLDFNAMCEFEVLQQKWMGILSSDDCRDNSRELDLASSSLIRFLELEKLTNDVFSDSDEQYSSLNIRIQGLIDLYVNALLERRKELALSPRRVVDDEQKYLMGIELLKKELKKFDVYVVEHMKLASSDCNMDEKDWVFCLGGISVIFPKLDSFRRGKGKKCHFHKIKSIAENEIRAATDPKLSLHIHWLVPSDIRKLQTLHSDWESFQKRSKKQEDGAVAASAALKDALMLLLEKSEITSDIRGWTPVLDGA
jgi:hypothetical protein